ncbi:uncharacterized protein LOC116249807 [Nymphaea colorata]|uniref:Glycosyl transferase family 1 domain-containing protein n=1 Tax=Nymphaea colorata TaxID=210225 RepID=A0A5K1C1N2_9MAGN|nr:uncharacterized protein LOC116249807 [Nymphaea colorata]
MDTSEGRHLPDTHHAPSLRWRKFGFLVFPLLIVLLAMFAGIKDTDYYRLKYLKSSFGLPLRSLFVDKFFGFPRNQKGKADAPPRCVLWMAPFLAGGGYSSEAWAYITALDRKRGDQFRLRILQHGDLENIEFWDGLPDNAKDLAVRLYATECDMDETIVICHSEPGAWYPPLFQTLPCPPSGYEDPAYVIGRTMFETDRVNREHVERCNRMDSVWVPTDFHVNTFTASGVDPSKVVKVVESVDTEFFDPAKWEQMRLPTKGLVIGYNSGTEFIPKNQFVFLSIFKWEIRKGWDVLLRAYLKEFSASDGVVLYLVTNAYHSDRNFGDRIKRFVNDSDIEEPPSGWAPVYLHDTHIPQNKLPEIYRAADAFVLPSRGEGWGRPHVEAMAMSLPVIATNWSGPTEYMTEQNSYPLPVDHMGEVTEGPFSGHLWAEPSVDDLRILMRKVVKEPDEARERSKQAREDMVRRFSPEIVAEFVMHQIVKAPKKTGRR